MCDTMQVEALRSAVGTSSISCAANSSKGGMLLPDCSTAGLPKDQLSSASGHIINAKHLPQDSRAALHVHPGTVGGVKDCHDTAGSSSDNSSSTYLSIEHPTQQEQQQHKESTGYNKAPTFRAGALRYATGDNSGAMSLIVTDCRGWLSTDYTVMLANCRAHCGCSTWTYLLADCC